MIDGINLMALTCTGSGKTGYFIMYMLLLLALLKDLSIVAPAIPKNPAMILVFPTNGVEEEMVSSTICLIYLLEYHAGFGNSSSNLMGWQHLRSMRTDLLRLAATVLIFGNWCTSTS
jgi:hypothetical protein